LPANGSGSLDALEGKVIGRRMQRHRPQEFIRFLKAVERAVPPGKAIHVGSTTMPTTSTRRGGAGSHAIAASAVKIAAYPGSAGLIDLSTNV
jgi:hypothetical protein